MQLNPDPLPITAGDDEIRRALEDVEVPPLLVAVATLTGDLSLLRDDLAPSAAESFDPTAGITPEQAATARDLAAAALARHRGRGRRSCSTAGSGDPAADAGVPRGRTRSTDDYLARR